MERLTEVLSGDKTIEMHLQFLIRSNKTDMLILKTTKVCTIHLHAQDFVDSKTLDSDSSSIVV
jgi:hypothetical protein